MSPRTRLRVQTMIVPLLAGMRFAEGAERGCVRRTVNLVLSDKRHHRFMIWSFL